ncbi:MAG: PaaI family thioesterase [Actinomycetota bacterium]|nr:PaaI family thioesterase [Actinomycetota bacterium]
MASGEDLRARGAVRVPVERRHQPVVVDELRTDHYPFCWGCALGTDGLGFDWTLEGDELLARYVVPERFQGAPGMAHGGVVAALLDEACGQVVRPSLSPAVTSRLEVRYIAPVPVEEPLRIFAELTALDDRRANAEATVQDESGLLLAHARAECVAVRPEHFLATERGRARGLDWLPR